MFISNIYIVTIPNLSARRVGRPRKQPSAKKQTVSVTLSPETVKKMEAVRQLHAENRFAPPGDSWMVQQGLERYFQFEASRFPGLIQLFAAIDRPSVVGSIDQEPQQSGAAETIRPDTMKTKAPRRGS